MTAPGIPRKLLPRKIDRFEIGWAGQELAHGVPRKELLLSKPGMAFDEDFINVCRSSPANTGDADPTEHAG